MTADATAYIIEHPSTLIVVEETDSVIVVEETTEFVEIGTPGPQGKPGEKGDQGEQGEQGEQGPIGVPGGGFYYRHSQGVPLATWFVTHGLGSEPNVDVFDTTGRRVEGNVQHTSPVHTTIAFNAPFSGIAVFS